MILEGTFLDMRGKTKIGLRDKLPVRAGTNSRSEVRSRRSNQTAALTKTAARRGCILLK